MTPTIIQSDREMAAGMLRVWFSDTNRYAAQTEDGEHDDSPFVQTIALARIAGWNAAVYKASIVPELDLASGNSVVISDAIRNLRLDQEGKNDATP